MGDQQRRAAFERRGVIARWIWSSVALSMALVESSRIRMRGSVSSARAIAIRWRCPPESVTPRSPIDRLVALRQLADEVVRLGVARGRLDPPRIDASWPRPKAMFSAIGREKRKMSCSIVEICERSESRFQSRTSTPSIRIAPSVDVVGAVDQLGQRALARAGLADDRDRLARRGPERDVLQRPARPP